MSLFSFNLFAEQPKRSQTLAVKPNFPIPQQADKLHSYMYSPNKLKFNPKDPNHVAFLTECTQTYQEKVEELKTGAIRMSLGFSIGMAAYFLSFVFPVTLLMIGGFAFGAYYLAVNQKLFAEYTQSLDNMMNALTWSTGKIDSSSSNAVINCKEVQTLVAALIPVATTQQLKDRIADNEENTIIGIATALSQTPELNGVQLDNEQKNLYYALLGFEQGSILQALPAIGHEIVKGFTYAQNALFSQQSENQNQYRA